VRPINKEFSYQRKFSIKGLFDPKSVFSEFAILEFKSLEAFFSFISKDFAVQDPRIEYIIHIDDKDALDNVIILIDKLRLAEPTMITIDLGDSDDLLDYAAHRFGREDLYNVALRMTPAQATKLTKILKADSTATLHRHLLKGGIGWIKSHWTKDNYAEAYVELLRAALDNPFFMWIDLTFDYTSFESAPMSELHKLRFYTSLLYNWTTPQAIPGYSFNPLGADYDALSLPKPETKSSCSDGSCSTCGDQSSAPAIIPTNLKLKRRQSAVRAFVDDALDLYLNSTDMTPFFKMSEHLDHTAEDLDGRLLNKLRQVLDVKFKDIGFNNMYLIDVGQNLEIMKDPYMLPVLTQLVGYWLEAPNGRR